jgi:hypothetical protein
LAITYRIVAAVTEPAAILFSGTYAINNLPEKQDLLRQGHYGSAFFIFNQPRKLLEKFYPRDHTLSSS